MSPSLLLRMVVTLSWLVSFVSYRDFYLEKYLKVQSYTYWLCHIINHVDLYLQMRLPKFLRHEKFLTKPLCYATKFLSYLALMCNLLFLWTPRIYSTRCRQRHPTDKSVRGDFIAIRFFYETKVDMFGWIKRSCNPADVCTKLNSPLV